MDLFEDLRWRGLVHQWTGEDAFAKRLQANPLTLYCGFDPSGDSLHVGSLVPLMTLRRFQRAGHRPIAVAGGATGMIGDPSGTSAERNLLSPEQVEANLMGIRAQIERFVDLGAGGGLLNNADWLGTWRYLDFLREVGKHVPMNVLLARESVSARLGSEVGISYTEFSYSLLQAYDFVHLYDTQACELQIGGADQYGNIVAGVDLARRMRGATVYGMTLPLITDASGAKFGKTAAGTSAWLSPTRTSAYAFFQFFLNTDDNHVGRYLRLFTDLDRPEIEALEDAARTRPAERAAQQRLAEEVTRLVHDDVGVAAAKRGSAVLFGGSFDGLSEVELADVFADVPHRELPKGRLGRLSIIDALCESGLASSRGDAKRRLESGGVYLNNHRIEDLGRTLTSADLATETMCVLRSGKRSQAVLRFV